MTETNLDVFHAQLLVPQDAPAVDQLCAACGTPGGPDTAALLQTNAVLGDYAGTNTLQAAMGMLPMFGQSHLALALRAARAPDGFGQTWATCPWRPVTCWFRHSPPERHWSAAARRYRGRRGCRRQRTADPLQVHPVGQAAARGTHQDWFRSSITMEYPPIPPAGRGRR